MMSSGRFLRDARLRALAAGAILWPCAALAAPAAETGPPRAYPGACSMTSAAGETVFSGSCPITRDRIVLAGISGARCSYARFEVLFPGVGLGVVLQGEGEDCPPRFQDAPAEFVARDKAGQLVVATQAGALVRFDPGPDAPETPEALPVLDDFLNGIEACNASSDYAAFVTSLSQAYPVLASNPEGPVPGPLPDTTILWPPGNPVPGAAVQARKLGDLRQTDVPLRGLYHDLPVAGLRLEAPIGAEITRSLLLFDAPHAAVAQKFEASVRGTRTEALQNDTGAPLLPDLPEGEPGRLRCDAPQ